MKISPLPENESERLAALRKYEILDTAPEQDFNDIVELASQICNTPIALLTLLDGKRQWFKAKIGLDVNETKRDHAFCSHAIHGNDIMLVPDATQDDRFFDNPLVTENPEIRFYAGMPLIVNSGLKLGTLCVIDRKPKVLNEQQLNSLRILGKQVINLLELRIKNLELVRQIDKKDIHLNDVFERIREGFIMLDKNWCYVYANKYVGDLVHRDHRSLIGKNVWEEFPDAVGSATYQAFHQAMAQQMYIHHLDYFAPLDLWQENHIYPTPEGISVFIRDISESKRAEESIRKAEERFRSIFENSLDGIYQTTHNGQFLMANPAMATIFGYNSTEELVNSNTNIGTQLYADPQDRLHMKNILAKEGKAEGFEFIALNKSKETIWVQINVRTVYDDEGKFKYFEGTAKDITSRKSAQAQIIKEKNLANSIINSLPGVFYMYDSTGKFLRWNKNFETVTGYTGEEVAKMHPSEFFEEGEERDLVVERIGEVFTKGFGEVETNFFLKNKRKIPYYFNGWKIEYENKTYLIGVGIDIAERKKAQDKLRSSENKLKAFFRSTPDASVLLGQHFEILAFNDAAKELTENTYGKDLNEGDIFTELIFPEVRPVIAGFLSKALNGETSQGEFPIPNIKTGKSIWWLTVFMPAYDNNGNIFGAVANSTNINDIKRAELKITKQFEELQKTNQELDRFVYSASHDLRAPLSSILGLINVAEKESPSPSFSNYLTLIRSSINRLDGFIKDILDYSLNSRTEVRTIAINFEDLIMDVQNNFRLIDGASRLKLDLKIDGDFTFSSDRIRLGIVFNNLFSNAIRYQDFQKEQSMVFIQINLSKEKACINFSDNGVGIEQNHMDKIFGMFYRASVNSKGSGLGLYIAKETITKLGGTIKVESEFGLSTTFEITIPNSIPKG